MAETKGKDRVGKKAGFEYPRNRTGKTRYEVRVAKAKGDDAAAEKSDAAAADAEAPGVEAKAAEAAPRARTKT